VSTDTDDSGGEDDLSWFTDRYTGGGGTKRHAEPDGRNQPDDELTPEEFGAAAEAIIPFAERLTRINGEPADYSGEYRFWRAPLEAVVDPDAERVHIWKMGRGLGKTEQSSIPELYLPTTRRMVDVLHTVPRSDQLNSYMKRTMARKVETSAGDPPILEMLLADSSLAVKRNKFLTESFLEARSAWADGRSIRGFHGPFGTADEVQDWTAAAISNLKEAIDVGMSRVLMTGTPDYEGTVYHEHWQQSTQHRWHFECPHRSCETAQTVTLDSVEAVDTTPKRWALHCRQCGERVSKGEILRDGFWEATNEAGVHRGYTMNQLLSPRHPLDEVMRARELASTSTADFRRYKLAQFYSGGAKPVPEAAIYACCDDDLSMHGAKVIEQPHFVGIDWGGGEQADTVATILTVDGRESGGFPTHVTIRGVERIEYESRAEELRKAASTVGCFGAAEQGRCVADLGYGDAHVEAMQQGDARENPIPETGWGSSVIGHRFGNVSRDAGSKWPYFTQDGRRVKAYQPPWANRVFDLFPEVQGYDETPDPSEVDYDVERTPDKRITIPYSDDVETRETTNWWFDHLTSVKREFDETKSGQRKERITTFQDNQQDDGFFSLLYALTAACMGAKTGGFHLHSMSGRTA